MIHGISLTRHLVKTFKIKVFNESIPFLFTIRITMVSCSKIFIPRFLNFYQSIKKGKNEGTHKDVTPLISSFCPKNTNILKVMVLKKISFVCFGTDFLQKYIGL